MNETGRRLQLVEGPETTVEQFQDPRGFPRLESLLRNVLLRVHPYRFARTTAADLLDQAIAAQGAQLHDLRRSDVLGRLLALGHARIGPAAYGYSSVQQGVLGIEG